jgi:ribosomal protein S1
MTPRPPTGDDPLKQEIDEALEGLRLQELDEQGRMPAQRKAGARGERRTMRGAVAGFSGDDVIVELGPRMQGVISKSAFDALPAIGAQFDFTLRGQEEGLWILSLDDAKALAAWNEIEVGARVEARVTGQNTGGLELKIGPIAAFMPASQVGLSREDDLAQHIGKALVCEVLEIDRERKRVTLSRRAVLEKEREASRKEALGALAIGQIVQGKVTRVEPYGAFVDVGGGLEALLHVSNISRKRVESAAAVLKVGEVVRAQVLEIKEGGKRIALGTKQLEPDPWDDVAARIAVGQVLNGRVVRLMDFGAFVELLPGIEGLLHVSQLGKDRVRRVQDAVKADQELPVRVLAVDEKQKRISLSRLDERGAVLGSEEAVEASEIEQVLQQPSQRPAGTNLGALFKKALDQKKK